MMRISLSWVSAVLALAMAQPVAAQFIATATDLQGPCLGEAPSTGESDLPLACEEAIAEAKGSREKAVLYFAWAYSLSDAGNTQAALPYLDKAIALAPDFASAWHERGYVHNDLGMFDLGLIDANKAISLVADQPLFYRERAHAYHWLARFSDELADYNKIFAEGWGGPDDNVGRAETYMWLGRYKDAKSELEALLPGRLSKFGRQLLEEVNHRLAYRSTGKEKKLCTLQSLSNPKMIAALVDACTWAFDHDKNAGRRAEYLTVRGSAKIVSQNDQKAGIADYAMAVAVEPTNPDRHANYGSLLVSIDHSWAARNSFDRALALPGIGKTTRALALGGRAQANFNLGDLEAAKADAKAALEIEEQPPALIVMAQLALESGDKAAAREYLMKVWKLGVQGDEIRQMLLEVGVTDPEEEPVN